MSESHDPFPLEAERNAFHAGIDLFNRHEFFEAHEAWEEAWNHTYGKHKLFYQGLIQCAVSLEHLRRGNSRGAKSLMRSCREKFAPLSRVYMGLEIWTFVEAVARRVGTAHAAEWPAISLAYDPFESGEAQRRRML